VVFHFNPNRFQGTYRNRYDAAITLAAILRDELPQKGIAPKDCVIVGIPRGGLYLAFSISVEMGIPLDCAAIGKVGYPGHPECAMLAVDSEGKITVNGRRDDAESIESPTIRKIIKSKIEQTHNMESEIGCPLPKPSFRGKPVIIADDGIATGMTAKAAIYMVRDRGAGTVILATPVIAKLAFNSLEKKVEHIITPFIPDDFYAVSDYYEDFTPFDTKELKDAIKGANWYEDKSSQ